MICIFWWCTHCSVFICWCVWPSKPISCWLSVVKSFQSPLSDQLISRMTLRWQGEVPSPEFHAFILFDSKSTLVVNKTNEKYSLSRQKFVENVGRRRKFVVEIYEKYVDQKNHQMVTHILGKACNQKKIFFFWRNIKKIVWRWSPKKRLFSRGGRTKSMQPTNALAPPPPPQISNGAFLILSYRQKTNWSHHIILFISNNIIRFEWSVIQYQWPTHILKGFCTKDFSCQLK